MPHGAKRQNTRRVVGGVNRRLNINNVSPHEGPAEGLPLNKTRCDAGTYAMQNAGLSKTALIKTCEPNML